MKKIDNIGLCIVCSVLVASSYFAVVGFVKYGRFAHREYRKLTTTGEVYVGKIDFQMPAAD